jgi:hypothetical protein
VARRQVRARRRSRGPATNGGPCAEARRARPDPRWIELHGCLRGLPGVVGRDTGARGGSRDGGEHEAALETAAQRRPPPLCPWPRRAGDSAAPPPERPPRRRPLLPPPSWPTSLAPSSSTPWARLTSATAALLRRRAPAGLRLAGGAELRQLGTAAGRTMGRAQQFCISVVCALDIQCGKPSATIQSGLACPAAAVFSVNRLCLFFTERFTDTAAESLKQGAVQWQW